MASPPKPKNNTNHNHNGINDQTPSTIASKSSALTVLQLHPKATRREIILQYRNLARTYHPDKWNKDKPFDKREGSERFKLIANARDFLLK